MLSITQVNDKVVYLKQRYADRDNRMQDILSVRKGNIDAVDPGMFPDGASKSMIANFIDVAARDISEVLAPLPSFNCAVSNMNNDRAKKKADKKTIIANHYVEFSKLQSQMYYGADWYLSYGFLPIFVEADIENMLPRIRVENPLGAYPEFDRHGRIISFTKRYMKSMRELIVEFPEYESQIIGKGGRDTVDLNGQMELIRYEDKDQIMLFLPERMLPLKRMDNPMGEMMVRVARRPGIDPDDPRGQFDDVIFPQLARARFAWLAMDAAEKSVNAPFVVPNDVQEFAFGPDAILRTSNPQGIRRVGLELPSAAFQEQSVLEAELRMGARYPEGRSGQLDASIITGSGVQALLGGFDTQVKAAQEVFQELFEDVIALCFKVDERLFGGLKKITGTQAGASYEIEYEPIKDISGDYSIQARYGLMAGLDPNRALIFALQALQADLVSHDFVMRELPWTMNVSQEQERIDVEKMRASLSGSFQALAQAIPQMASSGQDPTGIINKMAQVIDLRRKGTMIEQAVLDAFQPEPAPAPTGPTMSPDQLLSQMGGGQAPMPSPEPTAPEAAAATAPGEQPAPAGNNAPPDINSILSSLGGAG
jgi:hypothetical protein